MKSLKCFLVVMLMAFAFSGVVLADQYVKGYTKSNGTYVEGYYRSSPNSTVRDNYNYEGNTNPYTGSIGSDRYKDNPTSEYYDGSNTRNSYGR